MNRKWIMPGALLAAVALSVAGFALADDEDSPLHKLMETVNSKNAAINKSVRTPVAWAKDGKKAATHADDLIKLFKEAREIKEPAQKQKKSFDLWVKLMDVQIKETEEFAALARKNPKQADAKAAYEKVKKACADCHKDFRVEDDEKF
jgi:cytochrome c556